MFTEDDLLPISGLQHCLFCERQWALIHLEGVWAENRLTAEGRVLHERVHGDETETRGGVRTARGLRLRSLRLGLSGVADVVEFHRQSPDAADVSAPPSSFPAAHGGEGNIASGDSGTSLRDLDVPEPTRLTLSLPGRRGQWRPVPVEYKRGRPKQHRADEIQLCAQALCLEEMLEVHIPEGVLFYGQPHRRYPVTFDEALRSETLACAAHMRALFQAGVTPPARYDKRKCDSCSLLSLCLPQATASRTRASRYLADHLHAVLLGEE
jgi:CRISPR-associated exonuclease Cas4